PSDRSLPRKFRQVKSPYCVTQRDACATLLRTVPNRESFAGPVPERHDVRSPCELQHQSTLPSREKYTLDRLHSVRLPYRSVARSPLVRFCRALRALRTLDFPAPQLLLNLTSMQ